MDIEALRRRCLERLKPLAIPDLFDLREFCASVARWRGRPMVLLPVALPMSGPCGLWIATETRDYVCYEAATTRTRQAHIVLHEVGHMLCEHTSSMTYEEHFPQIFSHLSGDLVRRVLSRSRYSSDEEREAEMLASLVIGRSARRPVVAHRPTATPRGAMILAGIQSTIEPE